MPQRAQKPTRTLALRAVQDALSLVAVRNNFLLYLLNHLLYFAIVNGFSVLSAIIILRILKISLIFEFINLFLYN